MSLDSLKKITRNRDINKEDLIASGLHIGGNFNGLADDAVKYWNKYIPITPVAAKEIITAGIPDGAHVTFNHFREDGIANVQLRYDENDRMVLYDDRNFNLESKACFTGNVWVNESHRGQGYGHIVMRNMIEFMALCDANKFYVRAGDETGGFVWSKLGFKVDLEDDEFVLNNFRKKLSHRFNLVSDYLPQEIAKDLQARIAIDDSKDVWGIADQQHDILPLLSDLKNNNPDHYTLLLRHSHYLQEFDTERLASNNEQFTLANYMLYWTNWAGVIDLKDNAQMKRIDKSVRGFQHLVI